MHSNMAGQQAPVYAYDQLQSQPRPMGVAQTSVQIGAQPAPHIGYMSPQNPPIENEMARKLNLTAAILSAILMTAIVICLAVLPQVPIQGEHVNPAQVLVLGGPSGALFLAGVLLSCVAAFGHTRVNKRDVLTAATAVYSISVMALLGFVAMVANILMTGMYTMFLLLVPIGALALAIVSGISCSKYAIKVQYVPLSVESPNVVIDN